MKRLDRGVDQNEQADREQIRVRREVPKPLPPLAAHRRGPEIGVHGFIVQVDDLQPLQVEDHRNREQQNDGRDQHEVLVADVARDDGHDERCRRGAGAHADPDEREQAFRLLGVEGVGHEAPKHRQVEQAEQADPDVEGLVEQHGVGHEARAQEEQRERHSVERVDGGHEKPEANLGAGEAVDHHETEAQEKLDRPELRNFGVRPVARHRVADGPQEEVGRHDREAGQERHRRCPSLVSLDQSRRAADLRRPQYQSDDAGAEHETPERRVAEIEQLSERRALLQAQRFVDGVGGDSDPAGELDRIERGIRRGSHRPRIHRVLRPLERRQRCLKSRFFLSAGARLRSNCPHRRLAMQPKYVLAAAIAAMLAGCGGPCPRSRRASPREQAPRRETVFDPMTSTIGRAQGVQQTVDEQAAEQRRRIDEASR